MAPPDEFGPATGAEMPPPPPPPETAGIALNLHYPHIVLFW